MNNKQNSELTFDSTNWTTLIKTHNASRLMLDALGSLDSTIVTDEFCLLNEIFGSDLLDYIPRSINIGNHIASYNDNIIVYGDNKYILTCDDDELLEVAPKIIDELGYNSEDFNDVIAQFMVNDCLSLLDVINEYFDDLTISNEVV